MPDTSELVRVMLVDGSPASREELRSQLLGIDRTWLEAEYSRYELFVDALTQSDADGVIVGLDADSEKALRLIEQLAQHQADLPIIVYGSQADVLVQAHQASPAVKALLSRPIKLDKLAAALEKLPRRPPRPRGLVAAVLSSRGGVGSTSLAVNIGSSLAQDARNQVVLFDLDLPMGNVDVALDLSPEYRLSDVLKNQDRIDIQLLKGSLCKHATGLWILARPEQLQMVGLAHEEQTEHMLRLLRVNFTHLVLDLSKGWLPSDLAALRLADVILLVVQQELGSLRNALFMLTSLIDDRLGSKVRIVVNRVGAEFGGEAVSLQKVEEVLARPIYWQVPHDPKPMVAAWNAGEPLIRHAPKSKAQQSIASLASDLSKYAGRGDAAAAFNLSDSVHIFKSLRKT